ncbi:MAG: ABC transporter ATP-binding protein [Clostridia bacterium]|nr:ABC transporter ATP-binding protein [Clostridia bacterium]
MDHKFKGFWKYINPYLKKYYKKLSIAMIGAMLVGVCVAGQPLVIKYIVDDGISNSSLSSSDKLGYIAGMCALYVFLSTARLGIWRLAYANILRTLEGTLFNLRSHFFGHVQNMCMRFHESTSVGDLFNCIMGSPMVNIKTYMNQMFLGVPYQFVSFAISLVALASYDWLLTLILLAIALIMALVNVYSRRRIRTLFKDYIATESEASHYLNDTLHGVSAVKIYSIEEKTFEVFRKFISNMYEKGIKANLGQLAEQAKPEYIQYVGTAVLYFVGALSCIYRGMSVGVLYAFLSSMGIILSTLIAWMNMGLQKSMAEAGLYKILEILETKTSTPELEESHARSVSVEKESAMRNGKSCISFENVKFGYDNRIIFDGLSCDIKYNESVALVGGSGSGKSTFTKLAMRLYDVDEGMVRLHGRDVKDFKIHDVRVTFGVVPQNPFIFYGSIWENILIARPEASNSDVVRAMEIAHVHEFVNDLEHGWNTIVGDGALGLSGGQKQRIAIARAVLGNPDVLIFDEATSALDNVSERLIQAAMEELMKSHTVIVVAHRLSTIKNVDRIIVFDKGEIAEEGTYDELAEKGGIFTELLNS